MVPPGRLDERTAGDWWMVRSRPATVNSRRAAVESTNPRFCEGIFWEKRRKVSKKKQDYN